MIIVLFYSWGPLKRLSDQPMTITLAELAMEPKFLNSKSNLLFPMNIDA